MESNSRTGMVVLFVILGVVGLISVALGIYQLVSPDGLSSILGQKITSPTVTQQIGTPLPSSTKLILVTQPSPTATMTPTLEPTITLTPTELGPWEACPNTYKSNIHVGITAYVNPDPPLANNIRSEADKGSTRIGAIQPGEEFEVIGGPGCANGWVWWKVKTKTGLVGWTAEGDGTDYWILPKK
mgnify:CR=1 FL=1